MFFETQCSFYCATHLTLTIIMLPPLEFRPPRQRHSCQYYQSDVRLIALIINQSTVNQSIRFSDSK